MSDQTALPEGQSRTVQGPVEQAAHLHDPVTGGATPPPPPSSPTDGIGPRQALETAETKAKRAHQRFVLWFIVSALSAMAFGVFLGYVAFDDSDEVDSLEYSLDSSRAVNSELNEDLDEQRAATTEARENARTAEDRGYDTGWDVGYSVGLEDGNGFAFMTDAEVHAAWWDAPSGSFLESLLGDEMTRRGLWDVYPPSEL